MRFLFYIAHPSKFHLYRITINVLKKDHHVDIIINSKSILEELVKQEGWNYTNLFPRGRNVSSKPSVIKSGIKFLLALLRVEKYLFFKKKYDVFIDDALVINGRLRGVKSFFFADNDIKTVKFVKVLFYFANSIIAPETVNIGVFSNKKISFVGNKSMAHLHSDYYKPDKTILSKYGLVDKQYFVIRTAQLNATHDTDNNFGISDKDLYSIIKLNNNKYDYIIISEREIPENLNKYIFKGNPEDVSHILSFSKFFIGDSGTMATESAVLGVPNILINKLAKDVGVHVELKKENLQHYFDDVISSEIILKEFLSNPNLNEVWNKNKNKYINKCDDLNKFILANLLRNK